jgi:hypothetical protein
MSTVGRLLRRQRVSERKFSSSFNCPCCPSSYAGCCTVGQCAGWPATLYMTWTYNDPFGGPRCGYAIGTGALFHPIGGTAYPMTMTVGSQCTYKTALLGVEGAQGILSCQTGICLPLISGIAQPGMTFGWSSVSNDGNWSQSLGGGCCIRTNPNGLEIGLCTGFPNCTPTLPILWTFKDLVLLSNNTQAGGQPQAQCQHVDVTISS